jgi:signal transduction histidine kinase
MKSATRLLLIDDDEDDFFITETLLREAPGSFELIWSQSYEAGLARLKAERFDVCLVDYQIGCENGLHFLQAVKDAGIDCPIILLTGVGQHDIDVAASEVGAADFLDKGNLTPTLIERAIRYATAQARSLRALAEQRDVLETTLQSIRAGIAAFDAHGALTAWNGCFEELLRDIRRSGTADEAIRQKLQDLLARCRDQAIEIEGADGKIHEVWAYPMPNRGHVLLAVDVSYHKLLQQKMLQAKGEAEAASRAKSGFLANISHELRTPMNGVFGMASLLSETQLDPRQRALVETLLQCAHGLFTLIEDLLDISMIEQGKISVCREIVDVTQVSEEARTLVASAHRDAQLRIVVDICVPEAAMCLADPRRIRQILVNLLSNAAKFAAASEIRLSAEATASALRFAVRDHGPGVPEDKQSAIFERFVQGDMSPIRKHGGVGLGLAICKELVEQMGGRMGVISTLGEGAEFWFELPLEREIPRLAS